MWLITLALPLLLPELQHEAAPDRYLKPGQSVQGHLKDGAKEIQTPTLADGLSSTPVVGLEYLLSVDEAGSYFIEMRSFDFDTYLILRQEDGKLLAEDDDGWIGTHSRLQVELEAKVEYRLYACALHGRRGSFEIKLQSGKAPDQTDEEWLASSIRDAIQKVEYLEGKEELDLSLLISASDFLSGLYEDAGMLREAKESYEKTLAWLKEAYGSEHVDIATVLIKYGDLLESLGEYQMAEEKYLRALEIRKKLLEPDSTDMGRIYYKLGSHYCRTERYREAKEPLSRSLEINEKKLGPEAHETIASLNSLAMLHYGLAEFDQALASYQKILEVTKKVYGPEHGVTMTILNNLAITHRDMGRSDLARPLLEEVLQARKQALGEMHPEVASALSNLAGVISRLGQYPEARDMFERSLEIREELLGPDHPVTAISMEALALTLENEGLYERARELIERAHAIREKNFGADSLLTMTSLNNLAMLLMKQGMTREALPMLERVVEVRMKELGDRHPQVATGLNNLAECLQDEAMYELAEVKFRQALDIRRGVLGNDHPKVADTIHGLGIVFWKQWQNDKALELIQEALEIRTRVLGTTHPDTIRSLSAIAVLYHESDRSEEAVELLKQVLKDRENLFSEDDPDTLRFVDNLGGLYYNMGRYEEAYPYRVRVLKGTLAKLDHELPTMSEAGRIRLLEVNANPYRLMKTLQYMDPAPLESGYELYLQWKGKATRLQAAGLKISRNEELDDVKLKRDQIRFLAKQLSDQLRQPVDSRPEGFEEQVGHLRQERLRLEREVNRALGLDELLRTPSLKELQACIPEDAVLLDFFTNYWVFAWVITSSEPPKLINLGKRTELLELSFASSNSIGTRGGGALIPREAASETGLFKRIWQPLANETEGASTVIVSPDGFIGEIPFGVLQDLDGNYLLERFRFIYVSDATRLLSADPMDSDREGAILAVGDVDYFDREADGVRNPLSNSVRAKVGDTWSSLAATAAELDQIQSLHGDRLQWNLPLTVLRGKKASEERVRTEVSGKRYVHFATHGYFEPEHLPSFSADLSGSNPDEEFSLFEQEYAVGLLPGLLSGLVFAGVNLEPDPDRDDGYLSAEEIQHLDLSLCDLAVLSACETGLGSERAGEGMMSLRRAFEVAGAKTVVSSLWKVDDQATAMLMNWFYENYWILGMAKNEALHQAKLRLLRENRARYGGDGRPATWGAFVLSGDWN
ncbi:MAG: CHAT domain-containing protein [Planctomycetota bacterium]|nr:MAG: CHAT domain-containing protein [Planctomycetota bacterium]